MQVEPQISSPYHDAEDDISINDTSQAKKRLNKKRSPVNDTKYRWNYSAYGATSVEKPSPIKGKSKEKIITESSEAESQKRDLITLRFLFSRSRISWCGASY